ncbi:MAG: polysaccharide deacetylase family protein [Candidatus Humimicrobiaceae bacterium]
MAKTGRKLKNLIIVLIVLIIIGGGVFAGIRYYNGVKEFGYQSNIYNEDNFSDLSTNNIVLLNPEGDIKKIIPGEKIGFDINFKNNGALSVSDFKITLKIPDHLKFSGDVQTSCKYDFNKNENTLIFNAGSLKNGDGGNIKIRLEVQSPLIDGLYIESPKVKFEYFKESIFLNQRSNFSKDVPAIKEKLIVSSNVKFDNSFIKLTVQGNAGSGGGQIKINKTDVLDLLVFVFNSGTMNAQNVNIKITGLENLIITGSSQETSIKDGEINITVPLIEALGSKTLRISASIDPKVENNHVFSPVLEITSENMSLIKETQSSAVIRLFPDFSKSKVTLTDNNGGDTYSGEILNVNATVINSGDIEAVNVAASLVLPESIKSYNGKTNWEFTGIKPGASVTVSTQLQVSESISKDMAGSIKMLIKADNTENNGDEFIVKSNSIKIYYSKPFAGRYIPIVALHGIEPFAAGRWETSTQNFDYLCSVLKSLGYQTISLMDLYNYISFGKALPEKPVILTSDDGYQSIYTNAFPVLKKYGYKMSVFLIDGYIGNSEAERRSNDFDNGVKAVVSRPMLIWPEVMAMSNYGIEFGSHGITHSFLNQMSLETAKNEMAVSKADIESRLSRPCIFIAWPHDAVNGELISLLPQLGYAGGIRYSGGVLDISRANLYNLPRVPFTNDINPNEYAGLLMLQ